MKKSIRILLVVMMSISMFGGFTARAGSLDFMPGEVLFKLKNQYTGTSAAELFPELELDIAEFEDLNPRINYFGFLFRITLYDKSPEAVLEAIQIIASYPFVLFVEPNYIYGYAAEYPIESPVASSVGGSSSSKLTVTLTCATEGSVIYYTLDGKYPSPSSIKYAAPIELTNTTTIRGC